MNFYITTGTMTFMKTVVEKNKNEPIIMAHGQGTTILFHESEKKSVFASPRSYEVIASSGQLALKGYFALNHVPVTDEGAPIFEHRFASRANAVDNEYGFIAFRLLRPIGSNTYVVLTQWTDAGAYNRWKNSSSFSQAHKQDPGVVEKLNIYSSASYVSTYQTEKDNEEEEE